MKFKDKIRRVIFVEPELDERIESLRWKLQLSKNNLIVRALDIGLEKLENELKKNPRP